MEKNCLWRRGERRKNIKRAMKIKDIDRKKVIRESEERKRYIRINIHTVQHFF